MQLVFWSMYPYSYLSTQSISGLAAGGTGEQWKVRLKITIEWTQRYTPRPWLSKFKGVPEGSNQAYFAIHFDVMIKWTKRCTGRLWWSEFGDALGGNDHANFEAVIKRDWTSTWRRSMDGVLGAQTLFISELTPKRWNLTRWVYPCTLMASWLMAVYHVGRHYGNWI